MKWLVHRRGWFAVALMALWVAASAWSEAQITPAMHCAHASMPCCPHSGGHGARCAPAQCTQPTPQKTETRSLLSDHRAGIGLETAGAGLQPAFMAIRGTPADEHFPASVLQLKGELRI